MLEKSLRIQTAQLGSLCSFIAIVPWWNTDVTGARFGAFFDVRLIMVLLLFGEQAAALLT